MISSPAAEGTGMAIDTAASESTMRPTHPLEALTAAEIETAVAVLREDGRLNGAARFAYFGLDEPSKDVVAGFAAGDPVERRGRVVVVPPPPPDVGGAGGGRRRR